MEVGSPTNVVLSTALGSNFDPGIVFQSFAANLPGLAWIKDCEGRYVYVNDAAADAFGCSKSEIVGRTDYDLFDTEVAEQFRTNDREALLAGAQGIRVEERLRHTDGQIHISAVSKFAIPGPDGRPAFVGGTAVDVTEQRRAQAKLDAVFASIGDHLVAYDRQWRFTHVNEAAAALLGRSVEELLGNCIWDVFPEAVGNQYYQELHDALERQEVIRSEHFYEPFGKWYENHIYPWPEGVTVFSSDITWRKTMEEELRRSTEEIALANRRKDEFLAMLGHELRNPLAPLVNGLQLLQFKRGDPEALDRTIAVMERQVRQMVRLIDDLLDVSRISRGHIELRLEQTDLRDSINKAVEGSLPLIESRGHSLFVELPNEPIDLRCDPYRLAQVVSNLLNNAAKYTPHGGRIWLEAGCDGTWATVTVRDSGLGIPQERLEEIFDMFVQLERTPEADQEGLGLGLTLVKRLVELHGGTVDCRSEGPGTGATFTVRLPALVRDV